MKAKLLLLLAASMAFASGCSNSNTSTTPTASTTGTPEFVPTYLSFVEKGKIRIDLFNIDAPQFSFGNAALSEAVNTTDLKNEAHLSVNENTTEDKAYHFIFFAEKENRYTFRYLVPHGDGLTDFVELTTVKTFFNDFDSERGYIAISLGEPNWTKGLNNKFDAYVTGNIVIN